MSIVARTYRESGPVGIAALATSFVILVCLSIVAVDGHRTYNARVAQLHQSEVAAENLAHAMAQQASDTLQQSDAVLLGLVDRVQANGVDAPSMRSLHRLLLHYAARMPQFQLTIIGQNGEWLATSSSSQPAAANEIDRVYFHHHRSDSDPAPFLGPVIRSESGDKSVLTLSRRIDASDGSFAGVALVSIDLAYFDRFLDQFDVGPRGTLYLATPTGVLIDRRPHFEGAIGSNESASVLFRDHISRSRSGKVTVTSSFDGVERLVAYTTLDDFPLSVIAALSTADSLAGWKADAVTHTVFIAVLVAALALLGYSVVRQILEKATIQEKLAASQQTLEANNKVLSGMAIKDGLTGLINRREFDRIFEEETGRAFRGRVSLTIIMLDVDHFKLFNDRYGHVAGDDCLRRIAVALSSSVKRPGDVVARYGGEEFVAVLPGVDARGAERVAGLFCQSVRDLGIVHASSTKGIVTISAGIAVLRPGRDEISASSLLQSADQALYVAKENGRDGFSHHDAERGSVVESPSTPDRS
ncbi:MAG: diguanylate cyclase [Gemmatimonadota bacterium]|nr:diguanylate cyclase [Gemmatimonadota bacterium]